MQCQVNNWENYRNCKWKDLRQGKGLFVLLEEQNAHEQQDTHVAPAELAIGESGKMNSEN